MVITCLDQVVRQSAGTHFISLDAIKATEAEVPISRKSCPIEDNPQMICSSRTSPQRSASAFKPARVSAHTRPPAQCLCKESANNERTLKLQRRSDRRKDQVEVSSSRSRRSYHNQNNGSGAREVWRDEPKAPKVAKKVYKNLAQSAVEQYFWPDRAAMQQSIKSQSECILRYHPEDSLQGQRTHRANQPCIYPRHKVQFY